MIGYIMYPSNWYIFIELVGEKRRQASCRSQQRIPKTGRKQEEEQNREEQQRRAEAEIPPSHPKTPLSCTTQLLHSAKSKPHQIKTAHPFLHPPSPNARCLPFSVLSSPLLSSPGLTISFHFIECLFVQECCEFHDSISSYPISIDDRNKLHIHPSIHPLHPHSQSWVESVSIPPQLLGILSYKTSSSSSQGIMHHKHLHNRSMMNRNSTPNKPSTTHA